MFSTSSLQCPFHCPIMRVVSDSQLLRKGIINLSTEDSKYSVHNVSTSCLDYLLVLKSVTEMKR